MKIKIDGLIKDCTVKEVKNLAQHGYRSHCSKDGIYEPSLISIWEKGNLRQTDFAELACRRKAGEKFLKVEQQSTYVTVKTEMYYEIMDPIWRERKQDQRSKECIYKGKSSCKNQQCESCTRPSYLIKSLEQAEAMHDYSIPANEDVSSYIIRKELRTILWRILGVLSPIDRIIVQETAAGKSERYIAKILGFKSKESIRKRKKKIFPKLQKELADYR